MFAAYVPETAAIVTTSFVALLRPLTLTPMSSYATPASNVPLLDTKPPIVYESPLVIVVVDMLKRINFMFLLLDRYLSIELIVILLVLIRVTVTIN